jgi:hypothetical protein
MEYDLFYEDLEGLFPIHNINIEIIFKDHFIKILLWFLMWNWQDDTAALSIQLRYEANMTSIYL